MPYNLESHKQYLLAELTKEKSNQQDIRKELKLSESKINQLIGAIDTIIIIEQEQNRVK